MPRKRSKFKVPRSVVEAIPLVIDIALDVYTRLRQTECGHLKPKPPEPIPPPPPPPAPGPDSEPPTT